MPVREIPEDEFRRYLDDGNCVLVVIPMSGQTLMCDASLATPIRDWDVWQIKLPPRTKGCKYSATMKEGFEAILNSLMAGEEKTLSLEEVERFNAIQVQVRDGVMALKSIMDNAHERFVAERRGTKCSA